MLFKTYSIRLLLATCIEYSREILQKTLTESEYNALTPQTQARKLDAIITSIEEMINNPRKPMTAKERDDAYHKQVLENTRNENNKRFEAMQKRHRASEDDLRGKLREANLRKQDLEKQLEAKEERFEREIKEICANLRKQKILENTGKISIFKDFLWRRERDSNP